MNKFYFNFTFLIYAFNYIVSIFKISQIIEHEYKA